MKGFIVFIVCAFGAYALAGSFFGGEQEGTVNHSDCRENIRVEPGMLFKKFTCDYQKSLTGKIMGGNCVAVEMTSDGVCKTAYTYEKKPWRQCTAHSSLQGDDLCHWDYYPFPPVSDPRSGTITTPQGATGTRQVPEDHALDWFVGTIAIVFFGWLFWQAWMGFKEGLRGQ